MIHALCIVGTRPEAVKMAPVIHALRDAPDFKCTVLATAQHRELLDAVLEAFDIEPDIDLNLMSHNQSLSGLASRMLAALDEQYVAIAPDLVLAQGDTTTVMVSALAAFHRQIPFGHVEAGLRTDDMSNPFPEEMNRVVAGRLARWHFAPTESTGQNLLREGVPDAQVFVTGNTVIDALQMVADRDNLPVPDVSEGRRLVLVTAHRRENFGQPFADICTAILHLADAFPDTEYLFPVHPNPNVRAAAEEHLGGHERVHLVEPMDYLSFVGAMKAAYLILSDSGGVQEEAPALATPVLVLREETERPEAVAFGSAKLVGTSVATIVEEASRLLSDQDCYAKMATGVSPYGDGHAAARILGAIRSHNASQVRGA